MLYEKLGDKASYSKDGGMGTEKGGIESYEPKAPAKSGGLSHLSRRSIVNYGYLISLEATERYQWGKSLKL